MFNWLFPRAPLAVVEKAWVETRMQWLTEEFGIARLLGADVILPTPHFFSTFCDGTPDGASQLMDHLCGQLKIAPIPLEFEPCGDHGECENQSLSGSGAIHVTEQQLEDPELLAASFARRLADAVLPSDGRLTRTIQDREWMADLLPVFLGLGALIANAATRESVGHLGNCGGDCSCSSTPRRGAMPARMFGYAMALFAMVRGETNPQWMSFLPLDTLSAFRSGQRYLRKTSDSLFTLQSASLPRRSLSTADLVAQLKSKSPSARVAALWELRAPQHTANGAHAVIAALNDRQMAVREEAIRTLSGYGPAARDAMPLLVDFLDDQSYAIRRSTAVTLGALGAEPERVVPQLSLLLDDDERDCILAASFAIGQFGKRAAAALPAVLAALKSAMIRCDHPLMDSLIETLYALDADPTERVLEYFDEDQELREQAVHMIIDSLNSQEGEIA